MKIDLEQRKITANVDAFIVPNSVSLFKDFMLKERREAKYKIMLELSGIECNLDEQPMIQMWYVGIEDLGSDNLVDHGFHLAIGNDMYCFDMNGLSYIPYCFLEGKKEGDTINVSFPVKCTIRNINGKDIKENNIDWTLEAKITLKQRGYRYQRFGNFEDVIGTLIH